MGRKIHRRRQLAARAASPVALGIRLRPVEKEDMLASAHRHSHREPVQ